MFGGRDGSLGNCSYSFLLCTYTLDSSSRSPIHNSFMMLNVTFVCRLSSVYSIGRQFMRSSALM